MRVLRFLLLLLLILVVVAVALVALFPARVAVDWAGDRLGAVQLEGVGGTVWRGHAQQVRLHGQPLGTLGWKLHPAALFSRRLDADLRLDGSEFQGASAVSHHGSVTTLREARLVMPAERLQPALDVPALVPRGRVEIDLVHAELFGGFPRRLDGRALWRDAAVDGAAAARFGDLLAEFATDASGALVGTVADQGGPLMLDGQFRLGFDGYEADAVLQARDGNPQVLEALQYIGEPQPDGSSILQIRGKLLPVR
jgi:general secretion pathway protein N